jgi:ABC-type tungstate transport system permease subunit
MTENLVSTEEAKALFERAIKIREEAAAERKAAEKALADAEYSRGQATWHEKEAAAKLSALAKREEHLKTLNAAALLERERLADEKLRTAEQLMAQYSKDKHAALIAVQKLEASEAAARAAREKAA